MFADLAPKLHRKGWTSVIPIVPNEKRPAIGGWQRYGPQPASTEALATLVKAHPGCGVGFAFGGGKALAVDLDILQPDRALSAGMTTFDILGQTPLIRIGQSPKMLLIYRAEPGLRVAGKAFGPFEIFFGSGQCVFFGRHPNGFAYAWPNLSPLEVAPGELPVVTASKIEVLIRALKGTGEPTSKGGTGAPRVDASYPDGCSDRTSGIVAKVLPVLSQASDPLARAAEIVAGAETGNRHHSMFAVVMALATLGYTDAEIIRAVSGAYFGHFTPDEVLKRAPAFASAIKWARKKIGPDRFQLETLVHPDLVAHWKARTC